MAVGENGTVLLCDQFRATSKKVHGISDALVNSKLLVLFCDRHLYGLAIAKFYLVLKVLEEELSRHLAHEDFKEVAGTLPEVFRTAAIAGDLSFYLGKSFDASSQSVGGPSASLVNTAAVAEYCEHLKKLSRIDPVLLLAHSYTQHMAIMAGGQIIRRMARKHMALPEGQGTAFFEFEGARSSNALKNAFKMGMNTLGARLTEAQRKQLMAEHIKAFEFNNRIIAEFPVGWLNTVRAVSTQLLPSLAMAIVKRPAVLAVFLVIFGGPVLYMLSRSKR